ncbi:MAG: PilZ domain-containing protein [Candidatus Omnitrophota bacterium]
MKKEYPYLRDPRVISEIRKHQWIESEKAGREIGFGTAALDWITKYGQAWRKVHAVDIKGQKVLLEQRKYRRFPLRSTAALTYGNAVFPVKTVDVSGLGILCKTKEPLLRGSPVVIQWPYKLSPKSALSFDATVERICEHKDTEGEYTLLLKFNDFTRMKIENFEFLELNQRPLSRKN